MTVGGKGQFFSPNLSGKSWVLSNVTVIHPIYEEDHLPPPSLGHGLAERLLYIVDLSSPTPGQPRTGGSLAIFLRSNADREVAFTY